MSVIPLAGFLNILFVDKYQREREREEEADSNPFSTFKSLGFTACSLVIEQARRYFDVVKGPIEQARRYFDVVKGPTEQARRYFDVVKGPI